MLRSMRSAAAITWGRLQGVVVLCTRRASSAATACGRSRSAAASSATARCGARGAPSPRSTRPGWIGRTLGTPQRRRCMLRFERREVALQSRVSSWARRKP